MTPETFYFFYSLLWFRVFVRLVQVFVLSGVRDQVSEIDLFLKPDP